MLKALIKSALAANLANVTFAQELLSQMEREKLETGFKARNEHLYVHLMPHSHDDVGWLKTVDEYFTGSSQDIQQGNVRNIIDTVVIELKNDKNKRYT